MTDPKLQMARRIAEKQARDSFDPWIANEIRDGRADERAEVLAALAAIEECTEACARLSRSYVPAINDAKLVGVEIAASIRSGDHLRANGVA